MDRERFEALVRRLEGRARSSPRGFLAWTGMLAIFGYAYILGVLLLMTALCGLALALVIFKPNAATIKLGWILVVTAGAVAWSIARALWVRLEAPEGIALERDRFPELFRLIDRIRSELNSPPFHRVLLSGDHNAAVVQIPRLGIFGWHRNYLLLGLPLLEGLSLDEFTAVLAHEFGHLAGSHGRFGNWLYRLRQTWARTFTVMARQQPGIAAWPLTAFIRWFWPRFNSRAFVLSRANEYEADRCAAQLAGATHAANALVRLNVQSAFLEEQFWPVIHKLAGLQDTPPADLLERQGVGIAGVGERHEAGRWLRAALLLPTGTANTHPCLRERLQGLGALPAAATEADFPISPPAPFATSAAQALLGDRLNDLSEELSRKWADSVKQAWQSRHADVAKLRESLSTLDAEAPATDTDRLWKEADLVLQIEGDAAAQALIGRILEGKPDHSAASFIRGRHLLATDDPAGVDYIERAMRVDPQARQAGLQLLHGHFSRTGQDERRRALEKRLDSLQAEAEAAAAERANIRASDTFLVHDLTAEQLAGVRASLDAEPAVSTVDLVQKAVVHFPENRCYIATIRLKGMWWKLRRTAAEQQVVSRVFTLLPVTGHLFVFVRNSENRTLARAVTRVEGARIYERAARSPR